MWELVRDAGPLNTSRREHRSLSSTRRWRLSQGQSFNVEEGLLHFQKQNHVQLVLSNCLVLTEDLGDKDQFVKPFVGLLCLGEMAIMQKWAKKQIVPQKYMIISVPLSRSR